MTISDDGKQWELRLGDSTGVVKEAELEIMGLKEGEYLVHCAGSANRMSVSNALKLSLPIADAKVIRIEKM